MKKYDSKYLRKALKLNQYEAEVNINSENLKFYQRCLNRVKYFGNKKKQMDFKHFYVHLSRSSGVTDLTAKNFMFQEQLELAGKYLSRTAFWGIIKRINTIPAEYIDSYSNYLQCALFVEDKHIIELGLSMLQKEWEKDDAQSKVYRSQLIYPKTYLLHFLLEKWLGENSILNQLFTEFTYKKRGYGIYQPIIDNWADLTVLPATYWDELCEYHLKGLGLYSQEKWENEEFLLEGIIPMELLNLIKVRRKLGLDIPEFHHELFSLPTAKEPKVPTGYNPDTDILFQLVDLTAKNKRLFTIEEVIDLVKQKYGEDVDYFL